MAHIKYGKLNFIIASYPNNINDLISTIQRYKITDIVKACEKTYDTTEVEKFCTLHELVFDDGRVPSHELILSWINILAKSFYSTDSENGILIHCVAGIGRAPSLAAIALIVCENVEPLDCIDLIRKRIRYAFNTVQLHFLTNTNWRIYKKVFKKKIGSTFFCICC